MNVKKENEKHLIIVGFPKCGTVSLEKYLKRKYPEPDTSVVRFEYAWKREGAKACEEKHSNKRPVIIVRNPVDRIWSAFRYFEFYKKMSLEEFLKNKVDHDGRLGTGDPIECSDYQKWIDKWMHLNPIVVKLETMIVLGNFPNENPTEGRAGNWPTLSNEDTELITNKLNEKRMLEKYEQLQERGIELWS